MLKFRLNMNYACMIPARLRSQRFPKKMLAKLCNKPLLQWVWEAALASGRFREVVFAVDSLEIADLVQSFGGIVHMTSSACMNGSERLIELVSSGRLNADIYVCWQGDEPLIHKRMIDELLQTTPTSDADIWTLKKRITDPMQISSPNHPKVVTDRRGSALLFSRSAIPFYRDDQNNEKVYYKHIGLYAYSQKAIAKMSALPPADIEIAEQLEQLRWLYHGLTIQVHTTFFESQGIDLPEDLHRAEIFIESQRKNPCLAL